MADRRISDLNPAPSTLNDTNTLFAVEQARTAYRVDGHAFIEAIVGIYEGHGGIADIEYTEPSSGSLEGTLTITLADQTTEEFSITNGKGIASIAKTGTSGLVDTYTITYNDSSTTTFTVTNGAKGDTGDAWYVWIRYAATCSGTPPMPPTDQDIGTDPDNWIGVYSGTASTAPTTRGSYTWFEIKGDKGDTGDSISSITKTGGTGAPGTVDTYTAYVNTTAIGSFQVYNGSDGQGSPGSQTPIMDGTASVGTAVAYAREDHIHPTDTSRASQTDMATAQSEISSLQTDLSKTVILASRHTISVDGTRTFNETGITSAHVVGNWGLYSDENCTTPIPVNTPPCDLQIDTWNGGWTSIVSNLAYTFYLKPVFILPQN